ncbi:hypothetical protein P9112_002496 [Eukaryota sp. TZLM1-RC]
MDSTEGRVRVAIRPRPATPQELNDGLALSVEDNSITVNKLTYQASSAKSFLFDLILSDNSTQQHVYEEVAKPVVDDVLEGYNGTILAYGQTGTGKTYTLSNFDRDNYGIIPRALHHIFETTRTDPQYHITVSLSYIQIYQEVISDLLFPDQTHIAIREDPDNGVFLQNVAKVNVKSAEECMVLLDTGNSNRVSAFTSMNAQSSRSHAIAIVYLEKRRKHPSNDEGNSQEIDKTLIQSKLYLVDLAGSERIKKTNVSGMRQEEAKAINLSLSALGNVVAALADPNCKHVPYRDSKLTRLLNDSLGGNSKTTLICCVGPSVINSNETINTLRFADRATKVKVEARRNIAVDYRALCQKLQAELDSQEDVIGKLRIKITKQSRYLDLYKERFGLLEGLAMDFDDVTDDVTDSSSDDNESEKEILIQKLKDVEAKAEFAYESAQKEFQDRISSLNDQINDFRSTNENLKSKLQEAESLLATTNAQLSASQIEYNKSLSRIKEETKNQIDCLEESYSEQLTEVAQENAKERKELEDMYGGMLKSAKERSENSLKYMQKIFEKRISALQNRNSELENRSNVSSEAVDDLKAEKFTLITALRKVDSVLSRLRLDLAKFCLETGKDSMSSSDCDVDPYVLQASELFSEWVSGIFHGEESLLGDVFDKMIGHNARTLVSGGSSIQSNVNQNDCNQNDSVAVVSSILDSVVDKSVFKILVDDQFATVDPRVINDHRKLLRDQVLTKRKLKPKEVLTSFGFSIKSRDFLEPMIVKMKPCSGKLEVGVIQNFDFTKLDSLLVSPRNQSTVNQSDYDYDSHSDSDCSLQSDLNHDTLDEQVSELDKLFESILHEDLSQMSIEELELFGLLDHSVNSSGSVDGMPANDSWHSLLGPFGSLLALVRLVGDKFNSFKAEISANLVNYRAKSVANAMGFAICQCLKKQLSSVLNENINLKTFSFELQDFCYHLSDAFVNNEGKFRCLTIDFQQYVEQSTLNQEKLVENHQKSEAKAQKVVENLSVHTGMTLFSQMVGSVDLCFSNLLDFFTNSHSITYQRFENSCSSNPNRDLNVDVINPLRLRQLRALDSPKRRRSSCAFK